MVRGKFKGATFEDAVPFVLPIVLYVLGGHSILTALRFWGIILTVCSFHYFFVGFNAAHHHPDIFHDGDTPR